MVIVYCLPAVGYDHEHTQQEDGPGVLPLMRDAPRREVDAAHAESRDRFSRDQEMCLNRLTIPRALRYLRTLSTLHLFDVVCF